MSVTLTWRPRAALHAVYEAGCITYLSGALPRCFEAFEPLETSNLVTIDRDRKYVRICITERGEMVHDIAEMHHELKAR